MANLSSDVIWLMSITALSIGGVVRPRAAEHPVVQRLASGAEPVARTVVRCGDIAVDRCGDACDYLAHGGPPSLVDADFRAGADSSPWP